MRTMILVTLGAVLFLATTRAASPGQGIEWPRNVAEKIGEILEVKGEAMALPRMRTKSGSPVDEDGIMGRKAEALMDELGALIADQDLAALLTKQAGTDIKARIVLWAIDRKARKGEYERFARYYVNAPDPRDQAECIEYYSRPHLDLIREEGSFLNLRVKADPTYLIPRLSKPNPIEKEDQVEKNRLIMEYCYFLPPSGHRFDQDKWRWNLAKALRELPSADKTVLVFAEDARIALRLMEDKGLKQFPPFQKGGNQDALLELCKIVTPKSFSVLSDLQRYPSGKKEVQTFFLEYWSRDAGAYRWYGEYPDTLEDHREWTALAKRLWEKESEKEFAKWLLGLPAPVEP